MRWTANMTRILGSSLGEDTGPTPTVWVGDLARLKADYDYFFVWSFDTAWPMKGWKPEGWKLAYDGVCQEAARQERRATLAQTAGVGTGSHQRYVFVHDRAGVPLYLGDLAFLHGQICAAVPYRSPF